MSDTFDHGLDAFESYLDDGGDVDLTGIDINSSIMSENDKDAFDALRDMF